MALPYSEWLEQAQRLKAGRSARVPHLCGEGRTLIIEHNNEGFRSWCHRCNEGGFKPHGQRALNKIIEQWNSAAGEHNDYNVQVPTDLIYDGWPWDAVLWVSKANITHRLIKRYGIGYSPRYGRVYLPVFSHPLGAAVRSLVYYQGRAVFSGQTPKYLGPSVNKNTLTYSTANYEAECQLGDKVAVVTEDILSAIRVGDIPGTVGIAIMGTAPSSEHITYLSQFKHVIIWLDPDGAGRKAARKLSTKLDMIGQPFEVIHTQRDPKMHCKREMKEILWRQST